MSKDKPECTVKVFLNTGQDAHQDTWQAQCWRAADNVYQGSGEILGTKEAASALLVEKTFNLKKTSTQQDCSVPVHAFGMRMAPVERRATMHTLNIVSPRC